ncbi:MAG: RNA polymerase sigma factor [Dehalococcoidia bacterium]
MRLLSSTGTASDVTQPMPGGDADVPAREQSRAELGELSTRLARRDEAALTELYDRYSGRAFGLAHRILDDGPAAEDIVHDAFLWIWENAERIDSERGSAGALLLTVVHRRAIDQVRRRGRAAPAIPADSDVPDTVEDSALAIVAGLDQAAAAGRVRAAVDELNAEQREAVELAYFKGMTHQQIAKERQLPIGTVKSRLRLAMGRLRGALKDEVR